MTRERRRYLHASTESEKKATTSSIASHFRKENGGAQEMESDKEEERANRHRSSRIKNLLNVNVYDVLARSIECIDVTEEGPSF